MKGYNAKSNLMRSYVYGVIIYYLARMDYVIMTINNNSIVLSRVTEWEYTEWSLTNTRKNCPGNVQEKVNWGYLYASHFEYQYIRRI